MSKEEVDGTWASAVIFITRLGLKAEGNKGRLEMPQIRLCGLDSWKKTQGRSSRDVDGAVALMSKEHASTDAMSSLFNC